MNTGRLGYSGRVLPPSNPNFSLTQEAPPLRYRSTNGGQIHILLACLSLGPCATGTAAGVSQADMAGPSGLRSQVDGLSALTREHDLQLDQQRRAIAALDEEKVRRTVHGFCVHSGI